MIRRGKRRRLRSRRLWMMLSNTPRQLNMTRQFEQNKEKGNRQRKGDKNESKKETRKQRQKLVTKSSKIQEKNYREGV